MFRSLIFLALMLLAATASAGEITGKVVGILDGDTIEVLDNSMQTQRIRLAQIDAPEVPKRNRAGQAFGKRSSQHLATLIATKSVVVTVVDRDRYGRLVGQVRVGSVDANLEQVKAGMAFVFDKYVQDKERYYNAEKSAFSRRIGVWSQCRVDESHTDCRRRIEKPWEFRRAK